jgi:lambda family phage portal protein
MTLLTSVQKAFGLVKAAYQAATPSRFRRQRNRLGGTADAHYASEAEFWRVREYCRDMDRNDAIIGQLVDRAVANIVGVGFRPVPSTGDRGIDREIKARWEHWSGDPYLCDAAQRLSFWDMERLVLRHSFVDGDSFALPTYEGTVQLIEGDWVSSPSSNLQSAIVHGIEVDEWGAPIRYYIAKPRAEDRQSNTTRMGSGRNDYITREARDSSGVPIVLHMLINPKRITQTRGMSSLTPVFDLCGMFEDANFAKLVQQQISSCVAIFIERNQDFQLGARNDEQRDDSTTAKVESITPGLVIRGRPGEKMSSFSPNVTPSEWFDHIRLILRMIGANLGMPLSLALMDTTNTTFHGYRGELDQAKIGFRTVQKSLEQRFHRHIYAAKVRQWAREENWPESPNGVSILRHRWSHPAWPYIKPEVDVKADSEALQNLLISPRDLHAQRGGDWEDTVRETVEDRSLSITLAIEAGKVIEAATGEAVSWRDILQLRTPSGVTVTRTPDQPTGGSGEESDATNE